MFLKRIQIQFLSRKLEQQIGYLYSINTFLIIYNPLLLYRRSSKWYKMKTGYKHVMQNNTMFYESKKNCIIKLQQLRVKVKSLFQRWSTWFWHFCQTNQPSSPSPSHKPYFLPPKGKESSPSNSSKGLHSIVMSTTWQAMDFFKRKKQKSHTIFIFYWFNNQT